MAGPNAVTIHDDNLVTNGELSTNYYATKADVGKTKLSASVVKSLAELNPMVTVKTHEGEVTEELLSQFSVVVVTDNYDEKYLNKVGSFCHERGIGFISAGSMGLYTYCFVDFGKAHTINDKDG